MPRNVKSPPDNRLPLLVKAVARFIARLPLDCRVPLLVTVLALMMLLMPATSAAVNMPVLFKIAELLVKPPLASSVPELVSAPATVRVMVSLDCSVPLLVKSPASVRPTVLPSTVPDCVPKVTFVPLTASALPACKAAATPVLLMVTADVPALTDRLLVANTLPVLASAWVRFRVKSPLDCSVPLLVTVLAVMMLLMPATSAAVNDPELVKVAELLVNPPLASKVPELIDAPPTASVMVSFD